MTHGSHYLGKLYNDLIINSPQPILMDIPTDMGQGRIAVLRCHPEIIKYELDKEPLLTFSGLEICLSCRKAF